MQSAQNHKPTIIFNLIKLNDFENDLFSKLLTIIRHEQLSCSIRVAGGWVRDKLLGKDSEDIDLVVDTMSGRQFAQIVQSYFTKLQTTQNSTSSTKDSSKSFTDNTSMLKNSVDSGTIDTEDWRMSPSYQALLAFCYPKPRTCDTIVSEIGIIKSNPDQSKHLETATFTMNGISFDVSQFRSEVYHESRIPVIEPCDAYGDAIRRDFTINAMFYNIESQYIEDFCNGYQDIQNKIIRTPINPHKTFLDDPLRLLRAIRFAGKFQFNIVPEIERASQSNIIQQAFLNKVSRERITIEIQKMMTFSDNKRILQCFRYIKDWNLHRFIFKIPINCQQDKTVGYQWLKFHQVEQHNEAKNYQELSTRCYACLQNAYFILYPNESSKQTNTLNILSLSSQIARWAPLSKHDQFIFFSCAYLSSYFGYNCLKSKTKLRSIIFEIGHESISRSSVILNEITEIIRGTHRLIDVAFNFSSSLIDDTIDRTIVECGFILKNDVKSKHEIAIRLALVINNVDHYIDSVKLNSFLSWLVNDSHLIQYNAYKMMPLINGFEIAKHLELQIGPTIGFWITEQTKWQFKHIEITQQNPREAKLQLIQDLQKLQKLQKFQQKSQMCE